MNLILLVFSKLFAILLCCIHIAKVDIYMKKIATFLLIIFTTFSITSYASDLPLPRYASIRSKSANMRNGPAKKYPILWEYHYKSMPVQIIAEHQNWRKVLTPTGEKGWFHVSLLSSVRTVLFRHTTSITNPEVFKDLPNDQTIIYRKPNRDSFPVARISDQSVGKVLKCHDGWCKIRIQKVQGWVETSHLWGVENDEEMK